MGKANSFIYSFKKLRNILPLLLPACLLLSSCEKVIDLDLNSAEKKYVIEAIITDQKGTAYVKISETKDFNNSNIFPGISGGTVSITEVGGATTVLQETSTGIFQDSALVGLSGKSYSLNVHIGNHTFSALSVMPVKVNLDTLFITDEYLFGTTRKIVNAEFQDPPGPGNNYRFIQYVNTYKEDQIMIQNDDYTDGRKVTNKLYYFTDEDDDVHNIKTGDNVRIDMLCIDPNVFKYWFSLDRSATGMSGQATPSNPVSNIEGDALGYFTAQTLQTKTIIAP